ncbi:hypothetical protein DL93DRAFT_2223719 [Clavulina sp. PMI_390]|nr:hypothetical protein DL93DRAFT_2223719 [Clavulina sp. PMI_390]
MDIVQLLNPLVPSGSSRDGHLTLPSVWDEVHEKNVHEIPAPAWRLDRGPIDSQHRDDKHLHKKHAAKLYTCTSCSKPYTSREGLQQHLSEHNGDGQRPRPFKCEESALSHAAGQDVATHVLRVRIFDAMKFVITIIMGTPRHKDLNNRAVYLAGEVLSSTRSRDFGSTRFW